MESSDSRFTSVIGQVLRIIDPNANGAKPRKYNFYTPNKSFKMFTKILEG
jgi:hypothetical protein